MGISRGDLPIIPSVEATLTSQMESYLNQDLFFLVIQLIVNFQTGCVSIGEALARLNHPEQGVISADGFVPTLNAIGLHSKFDLYIFQKCCNWLQRTTAEEKRFACLFCNFSRKTLSQPGIHRELRRIADSYGIPPYKLGIEITEWEPATDLQQITENLRRLKAAGFRIILDDYGSGVTAESDLNHFPLDIVKLDHSLLGNTNTAQGSTAFRTLVKTLTRQGVQVVCEGIETEAQDILAREAGCHYGQGFLYGRPVCQDRVLELTR